MKTEVTIILLFVAVVIGFTVGVVVATECNRHAETEQRAIVNDYARLAADYERLAMQAQATRHRVEMFCALIVAHLGGVQAIELSPPDEEFDFRLIWSDWVRRKNVEFVEVNDES